MTTGHPNSAAPPRPPRRLAGKRVRPDTLALSILSLLVVVVTIAHDAGKILPETKLDLVVDPGRFLARATFFWDASADFGRIQNQAVGYLWPMGPFYYLGHAAGIPGWLTQRLWISLLVVLALWGMHAVLRNLQVGTPASRVVGAATYALAPSFLATMIYQSAAQIPVTALPWIMAPLLKTREDGTVPRSAVWRSALAVACIGAVNGAAAIIVLAVPVLWFATRRRPFSHWRMAATWAFASFLGMAWWLGPLLLQGRYGYAFTAYTERADLTTATQSATEVLRGTGSWLSYLVVDGHPLVEGARTLAIDRSAILATLLVAGVGLAGLVRRDLRERTWLITTLLIGVVATGLAFVGPTSGWAAEPVRGILDGALAPFRNVQKFEPLIRLGLAVGAAHLLAVARLPAWTRIGRSTRAPQFALIAVLIAVLLPITRAQQSGLSPDGSFTNIPQYWEKAVSWVDRKGDSRRTLLVPSSSFGEYTWGRPLDEPIQALSNEAWASRNIIPLGGSGPTRLLDELDRRMVNRQLGPGTSEILARMGVRYLLVRNDLDRARILSPAPALLRASLEGTPNLQRVAAFGPEVGGSLLGDQLTTQFGPAANDGLRAVEVWEVRTPTNRVTTYDASGTVAVNGGPESLFSLADDGTLPGRAAMLAGSKSTGRAATWAVTDLTRRRDATFAGVRDNVSYTLTPDEDAPGTDRGPIDRLAPEFDPQRTTADLRGAATIESSSYSLSDQTRYPGTQPWAAFDDDPASAWRPTNRGSPVGAWVQVGFDAPTTVPSLSIARPPGQPARVVEVVVTTDNGARTAKFGKRDAVEVALPPGATRTVRITISDSVRAGAGYGSPGLSSVELAGVNLQRPIVPVTTRPSSAAELGAPTLVFDRARTDPTNRLKSDEDARLDRSFTLDDDASFDVTVTGSPRPGPKLDALLREVRTSLGAEDRAVQASSVWQDLPAFGGYAAHDDDLATSWVAAVNDPDPTLTIDWGNPVTLSRIRIESPGFPAEPIGAVRLESPSGVRTVDIGSSGVGTFAPLTTTAVKIRLATPGKQPFAVAEPEVRAISEVAFNAPIPPARTVEDDQAIGVACGDGPSLRVDDRVIETSVVTTWDAVRQQEPAFVVACDTSVDLSGGTHRIISDADAAFSIDGVTLEPGERKAAPPARTTRVDRWDTDARTIEVAAGDRSILATTENANPGWVATYEGKELRPIVVDGWRQGWELPAGRSGLVELRFQPGIVYRGLLAGGSILLLLLVLLNIDAVRNLLPTRRTGPLLLEPRTGFSTPVVAVIAVVAVAAVAGPVCLVVPVLFLARRANVTTLVIGVSLTVAGFMALRSPLGSTIAATGTFSPLAQTAAALAIGAVAVSLMRPDPEPAADEEGLSPQPGR
jgi:arabinofuranan 3-O-arabinosyltransferase